MHIFLMQYLHACLKWETMGISGIPAIPMIITCLLQGTLCDTGIPRTFCGGKICSVQSRTIALVFESIFMDVSHKLDMAISKNKAIVRDSLYIRNIQLCRSTDLQLCVVLPYWSLAKCNLTSNGLGGTQSLSQICR